MNQPKIIFGNTVALGLSRLTTRVSHFLLSFLVARILRASGLGIYSAALEYYALIALAGGMGVTNFLVREIARDPSKTNHYVTHFGVMVSVASAMLMAVFLLVLPYLGYSDELAASMYMIILAVIPGTLNSIQYSVFVAHQRAEFVTYTTLVSTIVNSGISVYLLMNGYGVTGLVVAFVIVEYIVMICYFYFINRYVVALHWEFDLSFALSLLREIKSFAALSILGGMFARPEIIILSLFQEETQIGLYSAALKIVTLWHIIPQIFMTNVFPVLSRSFLEAGQKSQIIQDKCIKYLMAMALPLAVGMAAAAEPIVNLIYGSGFEPSITALQLMAWNVPQFSLGAVLWRVLAARNQQDLVLRARIITLVIRLVSGYVLISQFSVVGAAVATTFNLFLNALLLAAYIKQDGTRLNLIPTGWRFAIAALGMGILTLVLHHLDLWLLIPLVATIYTLLAFLLKAFSPDDFALFRKVWQPTTIRRGP